MKVLIVSAPFPRYSFVFDESLKLYTRGVQVHIARYIPHLRRSKYSFRKGLHVHNISEIMSVGIPAINLANIVDLPLGILLNPKIFGATIPFSLLITKLVKRFKIDLIHAHFAYPEGFAGLLAKNSTGKPLIVTLHGYDILMDPSIGYGIRLNKHCDFIVRKVLREADKIFVASRYVYQEALKTGCSSKRLIYIANGVDVKRFNPNMDDSIIKKKHNIVNRQVIFSLRWHEPKNGIEYLIKAVPFVIREIPNAIFIIGGSGILRKHHEKLAKKLRVNQHVLFVGHIPAEELSLYYAACDVFVIPSIVEAFGLVTVEAMACGKPVVGTNVGGIPDTIEDGVNGFLVEPRNPREIADKIVTLLQDPELRIEMGVKGAQIAETKFNLEKRLDKIVEFYSQLIH